MSLESESPRGLGLIEGETVRVRLASGEEADARWDKGRGYAMAFYDENGEPLDVVSVQIPCVRKHVSGPSGRSLTYAERAAKGRPQVSLSLPALTLAMLDRLDRDGIGPARGGRSGIVAQLVAAEYLRRHGAEEPWSDLPAEESAR